MSFAIIRNTKYKRENLKGIYRHNERKNKNYSNDNIDKEKSYLNYSLKSSKYRYDKEFDILNVASIAGFMPGPLMATYYSTKSYVVRLTQSIRQELFMQGSHVKISALCPGPVKTNFNKVADVKFNLAEADSKFVAKYAVKLMFKNRTLIFPSFFIWIGRILAKIFPDQVAAFFCYFAQKRKIV